MLFLRGALYGYEKVLVPNGAAINTIRHVILIQLLATVTTYAQETVHWETVRKIREEGLGNSHIMEDVSWLTDVFGPRVSRSPSYIAAVRWSADRLDEYGLKNVHLESYEFGTGWQNELTSVHMVSPQYMPIIAYPPSWTAGTEGKVRGSAVYVNFDEIESERDLSALAGKLRGSFVLTKPKRVLTPNFQPDAVLLTKERLDEMARPVFPSPPSEEGPETKQQGFPRSKILEFFAVEGVAAIVRPDRVYDDGTVMVTNVPGRLWERGSLQRPTELVMAAEHYNRILRILEKEIPVTLEVEVRVSMIDDDHLDYNLIADIPGSDLAEEVVMLGAHLDAHGAATGAEDNATGAAQVMEAARILAAVGVKPRRTIRFALWGGEELGHLGSRAYVRKHFVDAQTGEYSREHEQFSCYFNLDYGTGRIRGLYLMNNVDAEPIFSEWTKPLRDMHFTHLVLVPGGDIGSDHEQFEAVGLPVFPFLQDPVENDSRSFHSNMDVYDRIVPEYLIQGAIVTASLAYHAAMRDEKMPRVPER